MIYLCGKRLILSCLMATAVILFWSTTPPRTHAATITVDTAADELDGLTGNTFCSLREAIRNANLDNAAQVDCAAGTGTDTIIFASTLDGVPITLSIVGSGEDNTATGDLDIRSPITFSGNGTTATIIDGGGIDRVFDIPVAAATAVTFENLTIQNGSVGAFPGGGIRNNSTGPVTVTINNGQIANNTIAGSGGGISNTAANTINLNNSIIANNTTTGTGPTIAGGGIHNAGTLNITASTITDNTSSGGSGGGGIFNSGTLAINTSTLSNNEATGTFSSGGGLGISGGSSTLTNVTISGNRANGDGGGIQFIVSGSLVMTNVTITANIADFENLNGENGGGFAQSGSAASSTFNNVILAGNDDVSGATQDDCTLGVTTTITSNGYNLRYATGGCATRLNNVNDITSTPATLGLGSLQDNGGDTLTHNVLAGSDAIDGVPVGVNGCATTVTADQRNVARADGVATGTLCDVGAVEYVAPIAPSATNGGDGPGGVGVTDGSSSLELWLDGDEGVYTNAGCSTAAGNGDPVACWADQSGNNVNASQGTGTPTYTTSTLNGQPALTFNGTNAQLQFNRIVQDDFTIISAFRTTQSASVCGAAHWYCGMGLVDAEVGGVAFDFGMSLLSGQMMTGVGNPDVTVAAAGTFNDNAGHMAFFHRTGSSGAIAQYVDGVQTGTSVGTTSALTAPPRMTIGALQTDLGYFSGDMPEVIVFSDDLAAVERILVENYLSARYDAPVSVDVYDGDTFGNGDFDLNVAGIGQLGGNQHTQAHSVGMIVRDRSFLQDDGDWLLFGQRTATNSNSTNDLPTTGDWATAPDPRRWERHWFVDVTDAAGSSGGTVDIIFDFGEGSMAGQLPAAPVNNYRLLKRTLDTGPFTDIAMATAVVGDQVQFLGVDVADLGSNFTLATLDFTNSPTAVTMQRMTAGPVPAELGPAGTLLVVGMILLLASASLGLVLRRR